MNQDIETQVCKDIKQRQELGISKYGASVANNPLDLKSWLNHAYEETLDKAVYLKRAMSELDTIMAGSVIDKIDLNAIVERVEQAFRK